MSVKTKWKKQAFTGGENREKVIFDHDSFLGREDVSVLIAEGGNTSRQRLLTKAQTVGKGGRITAYARKQNLGEGLGLNLDEKNRKGGIDLALQKEKAGGLLWSVYWGICIWKGRMGP